MGQLHTTFAGVSIRRMSNWLRLRRSGYYEKKRKENPDSPIRSEEYVLQLMKKIRRMHRVWGFWLIFAYMRKEGGKIGKRHAHRLYMQAKMSLHRNPKKPWIKRVF